MDWAPDSGNATRAATEGHRQAPSLSQRCEQMRERHSIPSIIPNCLQRCSSASVDSPGWRSTTSRVVPGGVCRFACVTSAVSSTRSLSVAASPSAGAGGDGAALPLAA